MVDTKDTNFARSNERRINLRLKIDPFFLQFLGLILRKVVREALDWIDSLEEVPSHRRGGKGRGRGNGFGYFDEQNEDIGKTHPAIAQFREFLLRLGFSRWKRRHRRKVRRKIKVLRKESNCTIRLQDNKLRSHWLRWQSFIARFHATRSALRAAQEIVRTGLRCRYKLHLCVLFWHLRAKRRRKLKRLLLHRCQRFHLSIVLLSKVIMNKICTYILVNKCDYFREFQHQMSSQLPYFKSSSECLHVIYFLFFFLYSCCGFRESCCYTLDCSAGEGVPNGL